jgi:hypothetical protein
MHDPAVEGKLSRICHENNAHLSRNAFKVFTETDLTHRFLTMRVYKEGKMEALARFKACVKAVKDSGMLILGEFISASKLNRRIESRDETTRVFCLRFEY